MGATCPVDTECRIAAGIEWCATAEQLAACVDVPDGGACVFAGAAGACFDGVCLPAECGNLRIDPAEQCDDGGDVPGDGCSADCRSTEVCRNGVIDGIGGEQCDDGGALAHDGCSNACRVETPVWELITSQTIEARAGAAMTYDASRDRVLLFGGTSRLLARELGDLWQYNGTAWVRINSAFAPTPRAKHGMVYDAARHNVVLFGGVQAGTGDPDRTEPFDETWLWDGLSWTLLDLATKPQPRKEHAMAYDGARKRVVLYGGFSNDGFVATPPMDDTWEWDGSTWQRLCSACAPGARRKHSIAYDPKRGVLVMYGGYNFLGFASETWELVNGTWVDKSGTSPRPPGRMDATMSYDPVSQRILLMGGLDANNALLGDTWSWDGVQWTQRAPLSTATAGVASATHPLRGEVVVFGGSDKFNDLAVTQVWKGSAWEQRSFTNPQLTTEHAAAYDPVRGRAIVWGGNGTASTSTYELDGDGWIESPGPTNVTRRSAAMAYDPVRDEVILFGGETVTGLVEDTWRWRGGVWTQAQASGGPARTGHAMAFDGERLILFGSAVPNSATYAWTGTAWSQLAPASSPEGRSELGLAYDPIRDRVVLFGGLADDGKALGDTWEWDGTTWTKLAPPQRPLARHSATLVWDPWRRKILLFGGRSTTGTRLDDTWEFDGTTWQQVLLSVRPPPRYEHVMLVTRAGLTAFAGISADPLNTMWRYSWRSFAIEESCGEGFDLDSDGLSGCSDPDCWLGCAPLCEPGTSCTGTPTCGDGTCGFVESCRTCSADCGPCNVCGDHRCDGTETATTCPGDC